MFGHDMIHINFPFTGSRKWKAVEILGAEIFQLIYLYLYRYALNVSRILPDCDEDDSIAMCEIAEALA